jgi:hypothetical protein
MPDPKVKTLILALMGACLGLGLAWWQEADFFALFFAAVAAIAIVEAFSAKRT